MDKPVAEACLRNQQPIFDVLDAYIGDQALNIFEVGSGTGQHAVYVADRKPKIRWQPSDLAVCLDAMSQWASDAVNGNVLPPLCVDVDNDALELPCADMVFTANTVHFVSDHTAKNVLHIAGSCLSPGGLFLIYGPFNEGGGYTSEGNRRLDLWLKQRNPQSGIKDKSWVVEQAKLLGLLFTDAHEMPANNKILVFKKEGCA